MVLHAGRSLLTHSVHLELCICSTFARHFCITLNNVMNFLMKVRKTFLLLLLWITTYDVKVHSTCLKEKAAEIKAHDRYIIDKKGEPAVIGECAQSEVFTTVSTKAWSHSYISSCKWCLSAAIIC